MTPLAEVVASVMASNSWPRKDGTNDVTPPSSASRSVLVRYVGGPFDGCEATVALEVRLPPTILVPRGAVESGRISHVLGTPHIVGPALLAKAEGHYKLVRIEAGMTAPKMLYRWTQF